MPQYKIYLKNISDTAHDDPGPGRVKVIELQARDTATAESLLLLEIQRICPAPRDHYTWQISPQ